MSIKDQLIVNGGVGASGAKRWGFDWRIVIPTVSFLFTFSVFAGTVGINLAVERSKVLDHVTASKDEFDKIDDHVDGKDTLHHLTMEEINRINSLYENQRDLMKIVAQYDADRDILHRLDDNQRIIIRDLRIMKKQLDIYTGD